MNSPIPRDQWEAVAQFACDIVNATECDDWATARRHYRRFEAFVRSQARRGRSNPYVLESLADYTDSNPKAVALYRKALALARRRGMEGHTILLELAKRHLEMKGKLGLARRYLRSAWVEARHRGDRDVAKEALQIATVHLSGAPGWQEIRFHPSAIGRLERKRG